MKKYTIILDSSFKDSNIIIKAKLYEYIDSFGYVKIKHRNRDLTEKQMYNYTYELLSTINGFLEKNTEEQSEINIYTTEKFLIDSLGGYIFNWHRTGYKTKQGKKVVNATSFKKYYNLGKTRHINISLLTDGILRSLDSKIDNKPIQEEDTPDWL